MLRKTVVPFIFLWIVGLSFSQSVRAGELPSGAAPEKKSVSSKETLLKAVYDDLKEFDDTKDFGELGVVRIKTEPEPDYTVGGKPLRDLDENALRELIGKCVRLSDEDSATARKLREETRRNIELMLEEERRRQEDARVLETQRNLGNRR